MKQLPFYSMILIILLVLTACNDTPIFAPSEQATQVETPEVADLSPEFAALQKHAGHGKAVTVMTRNIYVGTNVGIVLGASDPSEIPVLAAQAVQLMQSTDFPQRAISLAREIALTRPHLIGLQEVALFRIQSPGDAIVGGTIPAEDIMYDYLEILLDALRQFGLHYTVAGVIENIDVELPMLAGTNPLQFDDIRLTDRDIVLARSDVRISNVLETNYAARLIVPSIGLEIPRGFVAVDAKIKNKCYRFVNTHLEPDYQPIQLAQAQELLLSLENESKPIIMVGDFNTKAPIGETYQYITAEAFVDVWNENVLPFNPDGFTSPHDADLLNPTVNFFQRIDLIFTRGAQLKPVVAIVIGKEQWNRTPAGHWPSDHGGIVARLSFSSPSYLANSSDF